MFSVPMKPLYPPEGPLPPLYIRAGTRRSGLSWDFRFRSSQIWASWSCQLWGQRNISCLLHCIGHGAWFWLCIVRKSGLGALDWDRGRFLVLLSPVGQRAESDGGWLIRRVWVKYINKALLRGCLLSSVLGFLPTPLRGEHTAAPPPCPMLCYMLWVIVKSGQPWGTSAVSAGWDSATRESGMEERLFAHK